jgi:dynein heavy chain 1, cytosolic
MKDAVRREINDRCALKHSSHWEPESCIAEAVLVADEVYYNRLYSECGDVKDLINEFDSITHGLIDATKNSTNNEIQKKLLNSRITIALYWMSVAKNTQIAAEKKEEYFPNVLRFSQKDGSIFASVGGVTIEYGFVYQGSYELLVPTQLTEQCYKKYAQAIAARMPCAAYGPAGTGKTETIKDFTRKLGRLFVCINISSSFKGLSQMIKNVAKTGWMCFDSFQSIGGNEQMLTEFYDQVKTLMKEGNEFGLFVTLGAGATETMASPDFTANFKHQIEMTVPKRDLIA